MRETVRPDRSSQKPEMKLGCVSEADEGKAPKKAGSSRSTVVKEVTTTPLTFSGIIGNLIGQPDSSRIEKL